MLSKAAVEGKLATRADASKHQGDYRKIVQGVNETLDAVIEPLNFAGEYVQKLSIGEDVGPITKDFKGDFKKLMDNLNDVRSALYALLTEAGVLSKAAVEGRLSVRGDLTKVKGGYAQIIKGVNDTLDAVIGPLNVAAKYVDEISQGRTYRRRSPTTTTATSTSSRTT